MMPKSLEQLELHRAALTESAPGDIFGCRNEHLQDVAPVLEVHPATTPLDI